MQIFEFVLFEFESVKQVWIKQSIFSINRVVIVVERESECERIASLS